MPTKTSAFLVLFLVSNVYAESSEVSAQDKAGGHVEVSMYDMSVKQIESLRGDRPLLSRELNSNPISEKKIGYKKTDRSMVDKEIAALRLPQEHVDRVDNAELHSQYRSMLTIVDKAPDKPIKLHVSTVNALSNCELKITVKSGLNRKDGNTGYSQYYSCSDGDVYLKNMLLEGLTITTVKELSNIKVGSGNGNIYAVEDLNGNSYTRLMWVSRNIKHIVDKQGKSKATRDWLKDYAAEIEARNL